jgi:hypothetical protein
MRRHFAIAILLLCTLLAASACGGDSKPDVCSKRDDLKKSVDSLLSVNPVSDGTAEVKSRLTDVQNATTELAKAAGDQFAPEIDAFKTSTAKVATDVKGLTGSDKAGAMSALSTDVPAVRTSYNALLDAVGSACD